MREGIGSKCERSSRPGGHLCSTSFPSENLIDGHFVELTPVLLKSNAGATLARKSWGGSIIPSRRVIQKQWLSRADLGMLKMMKQREHFYIYRCFTRWHDQKCAENLAERILKIHLNLLK